MRALLLVAALAACGPRPASSTTPLVEPPPTPLPATGPLAPGEEMVWEVYWQGLLVGKADLTVSATDAHSRFSTTMLAKSFANVRYHLATTLDRGAATASREELTYGGESSQITTQLDGPYYAIDDRPRAAVPGGTRLHTLHTAIASLRAWAKADAPPAYLWLLLRHTLYRLDVERPSSDEAQGHRAFEIHGVVRAADRSVEPVDITIWLSTSPDRTPLRFVVLADGERVSAELTETTSRFAAN